MVKRRSEVSPSLIDSAAIENWHVTLGNKENGRISSKKSLSTRDKTIFCHKNVPAKDNEIVFLITDRLFANSEENAICIAKMGFGED
jgi:hypothetical protein